MSIRTISTGQLRRMGDQEGLILQGCGGDPQEWLDGINEILAQECILKKGAGFEEAYTFRHEGLTCMLFPFKEDMEDVLYRPLLLCQQVCPIRATGVRGVRHPVSKVYMEAERKGKGRLALRESIGLRNKILPPVTNYG